MESDDHDYQEMAKKLNDPDGWDIPGIIADVRASLHRGEHVPSGTVLAIIDYCLPAHRHETNQPPLRLSDLLAWLRGQLLAAPDKRLPIVFDERDYAREYRRGEFSLIHNLEGLSIKWTEE